MKIIQVTVTENKLWRAKTIHLLLQVELNALPDIPEALLMGEEKINIFVQEATVPRVWRSGPHKERLPQKQN